MATNTYVALHSTTVTTATPTVTFSSIPQGYTDLVIVCSPTRVTTGAEELVFLFNGDTSNIYSSTILWGNGSTAGSTRNSNLDYGYVNYYSNVSQTRTTQVYSLMNYSNTTTFKTLIGRGSTADSGVDASVVLWRSTAAVNSVTMRLKNSSNIAVGSTFTVYGIAAWAPESGTKATGGEVFYDSTYCYHAFKYSGTFTPTTSLTADILVIAGGGGGGFWNAGGGGAGGLLGFTSQSLTATGYTVTVGGGGGGSLSSGSVKGTTGSDSQFGALTLVKGGGGGGSTANSAGDNGGSGGGAAGLSSGSNSGGSATSGQGYAGASGQAGAPYIGGGGGGAGEVGNTDTQGYGGDGINTYSSWATATFTGSNGYYAGGGAGGRYDENARNIGGDGGGGAGGIKTAGLQDGISGLSTTGGGGGGGGYALSISEPGDGGSGGSGIVIIRYPK